MKLIHPYSWELRKQLSIFIVIIFLPVFAILIFIGHRQYQNELTEIEHTAHRLIDLFREEQLSIIHQTHQFLKVLSHVPAVYNMEISSCNQFLQAIHHDTPQYTTIVVAGSNGVIDCCAIPLKKSIDVTDRSWFKRIRESHDFVIDNYLISRSAKKASLPFAYPLLDSQGELKLAIGAAFDINYYKKIFEKVSLPPASVILITDLDGDLLFQSDNRENCIGNSITRCRGYDIPEADKGRFTVEDIDGVKRLYWFERLWVGQESNRICILVGISNKALSSEIISMFITNITMLGVVALLSLILAWIYGGKLFLEPINYLLKKTRFVQKEEWVITKTDRVLPGELRNLSLAFDEMVVNLSQREKERDQALTALQNELEERKKTERALREREERLSVLFEQAADSIFVSNDKGNIIKVNQAACKSTGYTETELLGMNVSDIDVMLTTGKEFRNFFQTLSPGHPVIHESTHRRKDGSTFPIEITIGLLNTPDGLNLIGLSRDVTDRKKMEDRIRQAQKMESIGNLAGGIAHDFNNILFPIVGMAELLLDDLPPGGREYDKVSEILKAGKRGSDLVKQILAFSRQHDHKPTTVRLQDIIEEAFKLARSTIPTNIEILLNVMQDCNPITANATQLHQIAMNLITNAYHAVEENGGKIIIELKETWLDGSDFSGNPLPAGRYVNLSVFDNGIGIPRNVRHKIFEPYYTTKEVGKGTGLGLSVVFGIVKEYHGDIKVYSEVGKGTTFNVFLPISEKLDGKESIDRNGRLPRGKERILLIDDEEAIAKLEKIMLERLGYRVTIQTGSKDALDIFRSSPDRFDIVVTDMTMPEMTGDELAKEIMTVRPDIPIIICTGFSERMSEEQAIKIGIKGYLMKPVIRSEMAAKIRKILDESRITH